MSSMDYSGELGLAAFILGLAIVVLSYMFIKKYQHGVDYHGPGKRIPFKVVGVILVAVLICQAVVVYGIIVTNYQRDLDLEIELVTNDSGSIIFPTSFYEPIERTVRVVSGDARVSHVDTEHGRGLRVEFDGRVKIEGSVMSFRAINDWEFSMPAVEPEKGPHQWIHYDPDLPSDDYVNAKIRLVRRHPTGSTNELEVSGPLAPGWNIYMVEESGLSV